MTARLPLTLLALLVLLGAPGRCGGTAAAAFAAGAGVLPVLLPDHLSHGEVARRVAAQEPVQAARSAPSPGYLTVPLDHFALPPPKGEPAPTWRLKFLVDGGHFAEGGPLVVKMPGEGPLRSCSGSAMVATLQALLVCPQHRFFGDTVPGNDSSVEHLRYLTVEQNLADVKALIEHIRSSYPSVSKVVAYGGFYSGACAAWIRRMYPETVDAAIAESPPVIAKMAFPEYDTSNLVAISSPDARCSQVVARTTQALERLLAGSQRTELMELFRASGLAGDPVGETDFMYGLGDSVAGAVQYGQKEMLCEAMVPLYSAQKNMSDWDYAVAFANYTRIAWGEEYYSQCFYNSACMRDATHGPVASSARSWYWIKCTQLGYFQTAPQEGLTTRPRGLTIDRLLDQCRYIFGRKVDLISEEKVAAWNAKSGAGDLGADRIFETDYSDDPWKMASSVTAVQRTSWPLALFEQPFLLLTCDGCGHCGAGVPQAKIASIMDQFVAALASWGIAAPAPTSPSQPAAASLAQQPGEPSRHHLRRHRRGAAEMDAAEDDVSAYMQERRELSSTAVAEGGRGEAAEGSSELEEEL